MRRKNKFWLLKLIWRVACWTWDWLRPTRPASDEERQLFYKSPAWRRLSDWARDYYGDYCMCCGDTEEIVTDHIHSVRDYWRRRLDRNNVQRLCNTCNLNKASDSTADFRRLQKGIVHDSSEDHRFSRPHRNYWFQPAS